MLSCGLAYFSIYPNVYPKTAQHSDWILYSILFQLKVLYSIFVLLLILPSLPLHLCCIPKYFHTTNSAFGKFLW